MNKLPSIKSKWVSVPLLVCVGALALVLVVARARQDLKQALQQSEISIETLEQEKEKAEQDLAQEKEQKVTAPAVTVSPEEQREIDKRASNDTAFEKETTASDGSVSATKAAAAGTKTSGTSGTWTGSSQASSGSSISGSQSSGSSGAQGSGSSGGTGSSDSSQSMDSGANDNESDFGQTDPEPQQDPPSIEDWSPSV